MMPRLSDSTTFSWSELRLPRRPRTRRISLRRTASKRSYNELIVPETSESRTGELQVIALATTSTPFPEGKAIGWPQPIHEHLRVQLRVLRQSIADNIERHRRIRFVSLGTR